MTHGGKPRDGSLGVVGLEISTGDKRGPVKEGRKKKETYARLYGIDFGSQKRGNETKK